MKKYIFIILLIIQFISCNKENAPDCFKCTGEIITIERTIKDFNKLEINDFFNIFLFEDSTNKITIRGGKNLLPKISTEIKNNTLIIDNNNTCNWVRSFDKEINIYIPVKSLSNIIINGPSTIESTDTLHLNDLQIDINSAVSFFALIMNCENFHFNLHAGTGDYKFSGNANNSYIYIHGNGYVFAKNLITKNSYVTNKSSGDCHINACKQLTVSILRIGDVYYSGNPDTVIVNQISSTGKLIEE